MRCEEETQASCAFMFRDMFGRFISGTQRICYPYTCGSVKLDQTWYAIKSHMFYLPLGGNVILQYNLNSSNKIHWLPKTPKEKKEKKKSLSQNCMLTFLHAIFLAAPSLTPTSEINRYYRFHLWVQ